VSLLKHVVALLRSRSTPFALIGAAAMAVHGVSRSTRDLDLFVLARECLFPAYWDSLRTAEVDVNI
jgi:predicted nucleotidyltransferase